jgi:hypothetical protein
MARPNNGLDFSTMAFEGPQASVSDFAGKGIDLATKVLEKAGVTTPAVTQAFTPPTLEA